MTQHVLTLTNYLQAPIEGFVNVLSRMLTAFQESRMRTAMSYVRGQLMMHRAYRDTYNELVRLSDRELNDIGLCRGDIHSVAMEAYYDGQVETNPNLRKWV